MNPILEYIKDLQKTLEKLPNQPIHEVIELLHNARLAGRQVFIMGNGGSASTASHFACDLGKNTRSEDLPHFRVLALTDNMSLFSAYANDEGYENVFAQQLASFVQPRDVVIAISTSGNSTNVIRAIELANRVGAETVGFTGFDGGLLKPLVDWHINVESESVEQIEDLHLMLEHLICTVLRRRMESHRLMNIEQLDHLQFGSDGKNKPVDGEIDRLPQTNLVLGTTIVQLINRVIDSVLSR
jgi:D-sedoheptulose 7-phosphate isomerase